MKKVLLITSLLTASAFAAMAQSEYLKQILFTAGGQYSNAKNKVKVGLLKDSKIKLIDSIPGNFSNFTEVYHDKQNNRHIGTAHIGRSSGRDLLVRYDLDTYEKIDSIPVANAQAMAQNAERLLISKAFIANGSYVDIYNAKTGKFITEVYGISNNCKDIKIYGDSAFVTHSLPKVSNIYDDSLGYLSIVKISTGMVSNIINIGEKAAGIDNLIIRKEMDKRLHIYFASNKDSVIKEVGNLVIHSLKKSTVVEVDNDNIYSFDSSKDTVVLSRRSKDGMTKEFSKTQILAVKYANEFYFDRANKQFIGLVSDFVNSSYFSTYSLNNTKPLFVIDLGTSVVALKPDYRPEFPASLAIGSEEMNFSVFPNPFKDQFTIQNTNQNFQSWELLNVDGLVVARGSFDNLEEQISTENLSRGMFLLNLKGNNTSKSVKIIKQ